jgi:hypothetical protein
VGEKMMAALEENARLNHQNHQQKWWDSTAAAPILLAV